MIEYIAPKPYPEKSPGFFSSFFSFSSSSSYSSVNTNIGKLILPAQWRTPEKNTNKQLAQIALVYDLRINGGFIGTHDEALLDTIEMTPNSKAHLPTHKKRFIIKFNGNGGQYQDFLPAYGYDVHKLNATVIGFNYRGVGHSKKIPLSFQDLVTDGIAQVQRLFDDGATAEYILLDGHSLGGGVATMVAAHFHKINMYISLWNDRSFATISKAAAGIISPALPGFAGSSIETSVESTSWSIMKPSGWDANVADAYKNIPSEYKNHMFVAKKSDKSQGDGVISHQASLHKGVKEQGLSTGNKVYAGTMFGHNASRKDLISKENPELNGQDLFENFARKVGKAKIPSSRA